jgi:uncharacterized protein
MGPARREYQLLVKPVSSDCNMTCSYCFYTSKHGMFPEPGAPMSDGVLEAVISQYLGERFSISVFGWQGGEPTLAGLAFFRKVVALQQRHGVDGQLVGNGLQTNGLEIDREWAEFLTEYRFLVGLSIDGPRDLHDAQRRTLGGSETWERAIAAGREMKRAGVNFNILSVTSRAAETRAREIYRWMMDQGFYYLQFIPCVEVDPQSGEVAEFSTTPEGYGRFLCELFQEWLDCGFPDVSIRLFDSMLAWYVDSKHQICELSGDKCGICPVVERTGDVFPCDFFVLPEWRLGNVLETPLAEIVNSERLREFGEIRRPLGPQCRECEWAPMCWGGCLKDRRPCGALAGSRSYLCEAYRRFFAETKPEFERLAQQIRWSRLTAEPPRP